jgi:PAS domain S-box-containing protein
LVAHLRQSEERYRTLVAHLPNITVSLFDRDMRYILVEGAAVTQHGYDKAHIEGQTLQEVLQPELQEVIPFYEAALAGHARMLERVHDGRTFATQFVPVKAEDGFVVAGMAVSEDITERKQTEAALRSQKLLFENLVAVARATSAHPTLMDTLQDALDIATRLTGADHGSLFVCDATGAVTNSILARGDTPPEQRSEIVRKVFDKGLAGWVARERQPVIVDDAALDDRWVPLPNVVYQVRSALLVPIINGAALVGIITLHHGVPGHFTNEHLLFMQGAAEQLALAVQNAQLYDEQSRLSQQLYQAKEVAESANRAKTEFVSFASHELKNPMTAIRGYADVLATGDVGPVNETQTAFLTVIRSNVDLMTTLVSDLADITRIEAGQLRLEWLQIALNEVIGKVIRSFQGQIESKGQTLRLQMPAELPLVRGDRTRLTQILSNLVSNACKYTPQGGQIAICAEHAPNRWDAAGHPEVIHVMVQDSGIGISPEDQRDIFQKFFRTADERVRETSGTGLGLNITKYLVEMQGGTIWFESALGQGTTFHFTIPVAAAALSAEVAHHANLPATDLAREA